MTQNIHTPNTLATPSAGTPADAPGTPGDASAELLPGLRGYVENGKDPRLVELDDGLGLDCASAGVRAGARWRRDSAGGTQLALPWKWLDERLTGLEKHRGREWTPRDVETMEHVRAQTWNVSDVGQRGAHLHGWQSSDGFVCPRTGEPVELPKLLNRAVMLAIVWDAFVKGTGGVFLSRSQWATQLKCSPRTVSRIMRDLETRGLIRTWQMLKPAKDKHARRIAGSCDDYQLIRIGPKLDPLAPMAFERGKVPRRSGITRAIARTVAGAVRRRARAELHASEGVHYRDQCRHRGRDPAAPWSSSSPRPDRTRRRTRRRGAAPAPVSRSNRRPPPGSRPNGTGPQDAAPVVSGVTSCQTTPPLSGRGTRVLAGATGGSPVPSNYELANARSVSRAVPLGLEPGGGRRLERDTGAGAAPRHGTSGPPDATGEPGPLGVARERILADAASYLDRLRAESDADRRGGRR